MIHCINLINSLLKSLTTTDKLVFPYIIDSCNEVDEIKTTS